MIALMRRSLVPALALLAVAGIGACDGGEPTEPLRTAQIQFATVDGANGQGSAPIVMTVSDRGVAVDDALLADLAGRAALRTWPEDALVGFTVEHELGGVGGQHLLRLTPTAALEDRWYLAAFDSLPARVYVSPSNGLDGVRFRPGR